MSALSFMPIRWFRPRLASPVVFCLIFAVTSTLTPTRALELPHEQSHGRNPLSVKTSVTNILAPRLARRLHAFHSKGEHEDVLQAVDKELESDDAEIEALIKRANQVVSNEGGEGTSKKPATSLAESEIKMARELGLTETDIDDLLKVNNANAADMDVDNRGQPGELPDLSRPSGQLPPHMVVPPRKEHISRQETEDILSKSREIVNSLKRHPTRNIEPEVPHGLSAESASGSSGSEQEHLDRIRDLMTRLEDSKRGSERLRIMLSKARQAFRHSLDEARQESKDELDEMRTTIEEQKRAFDELFEEKQLVSKVLADEQKTLRELQDRIQHPDLAVWLQQRAKRAALLMETPETDAMKFYAKKYMAPRIEKMRHRLEVIERRVEHSIDHLLPAKYGSFIGLLLCIVLIGFPVFVTLATVLSLSTRLSLKQYVLLGNVFLSAFALVLCAIGFALQQDPLQTLYESNGNLFVLIQLGAALMFPMFLLTILATVVTSRDRLDQFVFTCELVFYVLVAMNYRVRIWRPVMLGLNIETGAMMYVVYVMDFLSMTMLTISAARVPDRPTFVWDVEAGGGAASGKPSVGRSAGLAGLPLNTNFLKKAISTDDAGGKRE